jgi:hypothetical protein
MVSVHRQQAGLIKKMGPFGEVATLSQHDRVQMDISVLRVGSARTSFPDCWYVQSICCERQFEHVFVPFAAPSPTKE